MFYNYHVYYCFYPLAAIGMYPTFRHALFSSRCLSWTLKNKKRFHLKSMVISLFFFSLVVIPTNLVGLFGSKLQSRIENSSIVALFLIFHCPDFASIGWVVIHHFFFSNGYRLAACIMKPLGTFCWVWWPPIERDGTTDHHQARSKSAISMETNIQKKRKTAPQP